MAQPSTERIIYVKIGDGASPEVFTHSCLINTSRGLQMQSNGQDVNVPDCSDPTSPAWRDHLKTGLSATISGSGRLDTAAIALFDAWWRADTAKNVQVWVNTHGYWLGAFKCTNFQIEGDPQSGEYITAQVTLESHGALGTYTAA